LFYKIKATIDMINKFSLLIILLVSLKMQAQIKYPNTIKQNHQNTYFGTKVDDPYQWLENDTATNTKEWVKSQNNVTSEYLEKIPYRLDLQKRFKELYNYEKVGLPISLGDKILIEKNNGLQNQYVFYIVDKEKNEELLIDPNAIDPSGTTSFEIAGIDKQNRYIAFSVSKAGSDWSEIVVYDVTTKLPLQDKLLWLKSSGAEWHGDGFYYSRYPKPAEGKEFSDANENHKVYYHKLGDAQEKDILIYEDIKNPKYFNSCSITEDERYLILYKASGTDGYETYYKDLKSKKKDFKPLFQGFENKNAVIGNNGSIFYIHSDLNAANYKVIAIDVSKKKKKPVEIIPEGKNLLVAVSLLGDNFYAEYLENACSKVYSYNILGQNKKEINLPGVGSIEGFGGKRNAKETYFSFKSFTDPGSIFRFNLQNQESSLFFRPKLNFNPDDFVTQQVWYNTNDNNKVSMFIVHKKDLNRDTIHPTYLYGYGGFNINMTPTFSTSRIMFLENGGVFAMPNLRGGGEYGEKWHQQGMLMNKQNVFDDFINAAEYLIANKYAITNSLGIAGGSNGGLLVGACMTQRPDLFAVALPAVGVMDMLKYHKFTIGFGWVPEYGSSEQSEQMFKYLYAYSPYHQLKKGTHYPATLVTTADHDDRVVPAHSYKFAARLQEYHSGESPVLIKISTDAGHGAGKPTSKVIEEVADIWSFFLWNTGVRTLTYKK
jgi:prolyl oligopeptidase